MVLDGDAAGDRLRPAPSSEMIRRSVASWSHGLSDQSKPASARDERVPTSLPISRENSRAFRRQGIDAWFSIAENRPRQRWSKAAAFFNNFPTVAIKCPDRNVRLDKSRTGLSGGRSIPSAERRSGLDTCLDKEWGGAALQETLGSGGWGSLDRPDCTARVVLGPSSGRMRGWQAP